MNREKQAVKKSSSHGNYIVCFCARKEKAEAEKKKEEEELADAMRSVTSKDFNIDDFVPMQPAPTAVSSIFSLFASNFLISLCFFNL